MSDQTQPTQPPQDEPVKNIEPTFPDGMKKIDTSKLDQNKIAEMLAKLKQVDFTIGSSQQHATQDDILIEGIDTGIGATRSQEIDNTGTKPRISFKQPKRTPPPQKEI